MIKWLFNLPPLRDRRKPGRTEGKIILGVRSFYGRIDLHAFLGILGNDVSTNQAPFLALSFLSLKTLSILQYSQMAIADEVKMFHTFLQTLKPREVSFCLT